MENERITFLLAENKKLANRNEDLEKELLIKDEIIRKQVCMMSENAPAGIRFEPVKYAPADTKLPERKTKYAAGYDFYAPRDIIIPPHGDSGLVWFDVKAAMPHDMYLQLRIRSSLAVHHDIVLETSGVVDADYYGNIDNDGNIAAKFRNHGDDFYRIQKGERCMQGIFMRYSITDDDRAAGIRGGGYGSTGK